MARCLKYARCYFRKHDGVGPYCSSPYRHGWQCRNSRKCEFFIDRAEVAAAARRRYVGK